MGDKPEPCITFIDIHELSPSHEFQHFRFSRERDVE
jgi:hypothetical protein